MSVLIYGDDEAFVHVYPQYSYHCDVNIIGNKNALLLIAKACVEAAENGGSATAEVYASDGEGYGIVIERTNTTGLNYTRMPYVHEWGMETEAEYISRLRQQLDDLSKMVPGGEPPEEGR